MQGFLKAEGVHASVGVVGLAAGVASRVLLQVASDKSHRARWLLSDVGISERELAFLATGELSPSDEEDS